MIAYFIATFDYIDIKLMWQFELCINQLIKNFKWYFTFIYKGRS